MLVVVKSMIGNSHESIKEKADSIVGEFKKLLISIYSIDISNEDTKKSMINHAKFLYLNTFHPFDHKNRRRIMNMHKNLKRVKN